MAPAPDRKAFGQLIGYHREQRGLSQGALAKAAGISRPYLSQVEGGSRLPSDEVMQRLLVLSGAPMSEFMDKVIRPALSTAEAEAMDVLLQPYGALTKHLEPEQLLSLMESMVPIEQMAGAMQALASHESAAPSGPEGWIELGKEDRRLVQRLVNRLRSERTQQEPATDSPRTASPDGEE